MLWKVLIAGGRRSAPEPGHPDYESTFRGVVIIENMTRLGRDVADPLTTAKSQTFQALIKAKLDEEGTSRAMRRTIEDPAALRGGPELGVRAQGDFRPTGQARGGRR